jgi:hypothetical protein
MSRSRCVPGSGRSPAGYHELDSDFHLRGRRCEASQLRSPRCFERPFPGLGAQPSGVLVASLPRTISQAGERAAFHSVEFFTARLPNPHTRAAYAHAVADFWTSGASYEASPSPTSPPRSCSLRSRA